MEVNSEKERNVNKLLSKNGLELATGIKMPSDASSRRYERFVYYNRRAMLMDAPLEKESIKPFIAVAEYLLQNGFSAPKIYDQDIENGLLLIEDLQDNIYTELLRYNKKNLKEEQLYIYASDVLTKLKTLPLLNSLPKYSEELLLKEALLLTEWYLPNVKDIKNVNELAVEYKDIWQELLTQKSMFAEVVVLRDYHADNLMWLPKRRGLKRVALLDFQDAVIGSPLYDLVSLLEDARRDLDPKIVEAVISHYIKKNNITNEQEFFAEYYRLAAQRNCKIVGIFARLALRDGKKRYLDYLPRVWRHLNNDLKYPALAKLKNWFEKALPLDKQALENFKG